MTRAILSSDTGNAATNSPLAAYWCLSLDVLDPAVSVFIDVIGLEREERMNAFSRGIPRFGYLMSEAMLAFVTIISLLPMAPGLWFARRELGRSTATISSDASPSSLSNPSE